MKRQGRGGGSYSGHFPPPGEVPSVAAAEEEQAVYEDDTEEAEGDEDEFASDFSALDSFLNKEGVVTKALDLTTAADEVVEDDLPKPIPITPKGAALQQHASFSTAAAAARPPPRASSTPSSLVPPSPVNMVAPRSPATTSASSFRNSNARWGHYSSADEASPLASPVSHVGGGGLWPASPPPSGPNSRPASRGRMTASSSRHHHQQQQSIDISGASSLSAGAGYNYDDYQDFHPEDQGPPSSSRPASPSPAKSAALISSLRLYSLSSPPSLRRHHRRGEDQQQHFRSVREALSLLTRHQGDGRSRRGGQGEGGGRRGPPDMARLSAMARRPHSSSASRRFALDDDETNCTFKFRKSAAARAAERNPGCGYDFVRDQDGEDGAGAGGKEDFLRRAEALEKKRRSTREYEQGAQEYDAKPLDKKVCRGCGAVQSYAEVVDKKKKCANCLEDYRPQHAFHWQHWQQRLAQASRASRLRKARLRRDLLCERFGGFHNIPKDERESLPEELRCPPKQALAWTTLLPSTTTMMTDHKKKQGPAAAAEGGRASSRGRGKRRVDDGRPLSPERKVVEEVRRLVGAGLVGLSSLRAALDTIDQQPPTNKQKPHPPPPTAAASVLGSGSATQPRPTTARAPGGLVPAPPAPAAAAGQQQQSRGATTSGAVDAAPPRRRPSLETSGSSSSSRARTVLAPTSAFSNDSNRQQPQPPSRRDEADKEAATKPAAVRRKSSSSGGGTGRRGSKGAKAGGGGGGAVSAAAAEAIFHQLITGIDG